MTEQGNRRSALIAASKIGDFLQAVYRCCVADRSDRDDLALVIAALHNEGLVDVIVEFDKLRNKAARGTNFFLTRHVFEKALPHIHAPVDAVMRCVLQLYRDAGNDMAAGAIFEGYIGFCRNDPSRPSEALRAIEARPDELVDMLPSTIAAGSQIDHSRYLAEALRLAQHVDVALRRRAVFSVSLVQWPKGADVPGSVIDALESAAAGDDDDTLASAVRASFALLRQDPKVESRVTALVGVALSNGGDITKHAAASLFGFHTKELPTPLLDLLLHHLKDVNPENRGTLENVDYGIAHLIKDGDPAKGLRLLEDLLLAHEGKLTLEAFDSAGANIRENNALISRVLTRWFLSGEPVLCEAVHEIGGTHHGKDLVIEIDADELKPADRFRTIFVARKAIGYFFFKPITAASVVISLMHHAPDDETREALSQLLFDPLLLNYTGSARDYAKERSTTETGAIKHMIDNALAAIDEYLETLRQVPNLPALHPGEAQRDVYRRHMSESTTRSFKAAEKKSVFFGIFAKSTLLYGRKSINYVDAGKGESRRMEIPLKSHSVTMEIPRMDNLDAHGINFMLRVFRVERLRA